MSRVVLFYGEQTLLDKYNNHVVEKLNEKSPEKGRKSTASVGFTRGIRQMMEDIETYDPSNSLFRSPAGGLFDTKKDFYRPISLLITDLGLMFGIRSPSSWQVISDLRNQNIISEFFSARLKVFLSITNKIRLKTYFANGGQKEQFSPLLQSVETPEQSNDDPIFRDIDEDTLVDLLNTSMELHDCFYVICLKYAQQDKVEQHRKVNQQDEVDQLDEISTILNGLVCLTACTVYIRLEKNAKAFEYLKYIPKDDTPEFAMCRGLLHHVKGECKKAMECYETVLEYSQDPYTILSTHKALADLLTQCFQLKKAKNKLEEAIKLHEEIYGEGSETIILSNLMLDLGALFRLLGEFQSAIEHVQRAEQIQKRMTRCTSIDVITLSIVMADLYSKLRQNDRSLDYLERALCLSHKIFGEHNVTSQLLNIYVNAAVVYVECARFKEALSLQERSLKLAESLYGDTLHPGNTVEIEEKLELKILFGLFTKSFLSSSQQIVLIIEI